MGDKTEVVRGRFVTVRFDAGKCIHSRHCVLDHPDVFVPQVEGDWIHPDAASSEVVMSIARNCPSGAISCERHDGGEPEVAPKVNTVRVRENGPLAFHAALRFHGGGEALRATLCRCGASQAKPFCDTSHVAAGFSATGEVATQDSPALAVRDGPLDVIPIENGPLHVKGNLEIVTGTGRTVKRVTECKLCRCGHSDRKPFCDGTHRKVGFLAAGLTPPRK
ncbi:MAG: CDGSH iron-sulfur domain-containing protein [Steroidobacteraceae bacterium]